MSETQKKRIQLPPKTREAMKEFCRTGEQTDPLGMYTGTPTAKDGQKEQNEVPTQDADDL